MKKLYLFAILALVFAVMLSACAAPAAPAESGAMPEEMVEEVTIKIITAQGPLADGLVALIPQFEDENPGIKVEVVPFPWTTFFEKVISLARSKSGEFDVIFADDPWMPNIVDGGLSVNLTEAYGATRDDDVPEISYDVFSWPPPYGPIPKDFQTGERPDLHALPIQGNVIMFYIRQDILDEQGLAPPETWDDVLKIAETVHCPDCDPPFYAYNVRGAAGSDALALLWSLGGGIFDDEFNVILDNEAGCDALKLYEQLSKYLPPGGNTYGTTEMVAEVISGRAMMGIGWPGDAYAAFEDETDSDVAGKILYLPLPASEVGAPHVSMMGHWGLVLNAHSENKDATWAYMEWMHYNQEHALAYAHAGGIPFRKSVFNDPELILEKPWFPAQFEALMVPPKWRPRSTQATGISLAILGPAFSAVGAGDMTGQEACEQAGAEIRLEMEGVTN